MNTKRYEVKFFDLVTDKLLFFIETKAKDKLDALRIALEMEGCGDDFSEAENINELKEFCEENGFIADVYEIKKEEF